MTTHDTSTPRETVGNYDLVEKIADGSMGTVYKGRHWQTGAEVAVKVLSKEVARNPVLLKRFEQEFTVTSKLEHPNIVRMIEYCGVGAAPFIVMEYVAGEALGERLERAGKMSEEEALRIIVQVAHGLHRAHRQGLIHRDVKPDNILVTPDGTAKLTDLGLAKDIDASMDLTRTGRGLGTPNYMAPEQFRNAKNASIRCDIYSLGASLYEMVTGQIPFGQTDPVQTMLAKLRNELPAPCQLTPTLSERVDWAIRRAMSADPNQRPASCREFVEDLTGTSTRLGEEGNDAPSPDDVWYLVYSDREEMIRTAQGGTQEMRRALGEGELGDRSRVRASRSKTGPFEALDSFAEFRDLVVQPAPGPALSETSAANLARLGQIMQGQRPAAPTPADDGASPTFRLPDTTAGPRDQEAAPEWLKTVLIVVVTILATMLAGKFLLPLWPR